MEYLNHILRDTVRPPTPAHSPSRTGPCSDSPLAVRASKAGEHSRHIQIFTRGCTIRQRHILFSSEQDIMDMGAKVTHAPTSIVTSPPARRRECSRRSSYDEHGQSHDVSMHDFGLVRRCLLVIGGHPSEWASRSELVFEC